MKSPEEIKEMSYTDFVGYINQWNVPPGAYDTVNRWRIFSDLNEDSRILEVGCTTGFSSRELSIMSGCKGLGFDLSSPAIEAANKNLNKYTPDSEIEYLVEDGYEFNSNEKFSHIVIGASLGFFPKPEKMLNICLKNLERRGYVLASPFFIKEPIPESLILEFEEVFDIKPTTKSYKDVMKKFRGLEIIYEQKKELNKETEEELKHYCKSTADRVSEEKDIDEENVKRAIEERLYKIKKMSNRLREYQGYSVLVLRYRKRKYPRRYTELF